MKYFPNFSIIYWRWTLSMARVFGLKASRLSEDYEYLAESSEDFIRITMLRLTPARLT